jgi:putative RNA 2'-phosphotransferase
MSKSKVEKTQRALGFVLRHHPEEYGIVLDSAGWVDVDVLVAAISKHKTPITLEILQQAVASSNKTRYAFSEDGKRIRANQGHSVEVDLELPDSEPPETLFHGSAEQFIASIKATGLNKGKRHDVHLSTNDETATKVGKRHGEVVLLTIRSGAMHRDGYKFQLSANGVWLTDNVPSQYIDFPEK